MKLSVQSHTSIVAAVRKALNDYSSRHKASLVTDIHLQPNPQSGKLMLYNDDDEKLASISVSEWMEANPENFYADAEMSLKKVLNQLREEGALASLKILKPYSFVLIDGDKETVAELMLMDDDGTMFLSDDLLKGLDEELDAFLKDLLEN